MPTFTLLKSLVTKYLVKRIKENEVLRKKGFIFEQVNIRICFLSI